MATGPRARELRTGPVAAWQNKEAVRMAGPAHADARRAEGMSHDARAGYLGAAGRANGGWPAGGTGGSTEPPPPPPPPITAGSPPQFDCDHASGVKPQQGFQPQLALLSAYVGSLQGSPGLPAYGSSPSGSVSVAGLFTTRVAQIRALSSLRSRAAGRFCLSSSQFASMRRAACLSPLPGLPGL